MLKRILVVDDEPDIAALMRRLMELAGPYEVLELTDSRGAVEAARNFRPDVILLDLMMPEPNGSEVAALLQAEPGLAPIPVIFLTGLVTHEEVCGDRFGLRRQYYEPKPVDLDHLVRRIEELTGGGEGGGAAGDAATWPLSPPRG